MKTLCLTIIFAFTGLCMMGQNPADPPQGNGTENDIYETGTIENLEWGAQEVNNDEYILKARAIKPINQWTAAEDPKDSTTLICWLDFTGKRFDYDHIMLYWETAAKGNIDYYEIQCSQTGEEFTNRGTVIGSGNTNQVVSYEFHDNVSDVETCYYRLKQVDYNGQYEYSQTIVIPATQDEEEHKLAVFPNPATTQVTIIFPMPLSKDTKLHLYKSLGQKIQSFTMPASTRQHTIELSRDLPGGIYYIKTEGENSISQKIIID